MVQENVNLEIDTEIMKISQKWTELKASEDKEASKAKIKAL